MEFSDRLLDFPVRTAAVAAFLADLKARGIADVSALQGVIGDTVLWNELYAYWSGRGWIRPAPHSPTQVFSGDRLEPDLPLRAFCGVEYDSPAAEGEITEER
jgi:hypothetical protein